MIVYNVQRRWFSMKNEANAYRRELKLPPEALYKLELSTREELAFLLNGLCNNGNAMIDAVMALAPEPLTAAELLPVVVRNGVREDIPDYVPLFLRTEWEAKWARDDKKGSE
jgi:hypothetical protein